MNYCLWFEKQNGPQVRRRINETCGPPGGLVGIDQEVVTLTWPLRQLPGHEITFTNSRGMKLPTDRVRRINLCSPVSVRAVVSGICSRLSGANA